MAIFSIPNTRVSDQFVRYQLLSQVQSNQIDLLRTQDQLSTGRKFQMPSEDPVAALQVMGLQQILARNTQVGSNLSTNQSYLSATDSALSQVSTLIDGVQGDAQAVVGQPATDQQRQAAAQEVRQALGQLIDMGNQQFRGRYLFAGSATGVQPFQATGNVVSYQGNENHISSFGDLSLLFDTNLQGNEVFGALSDAVRGTANLQPALTFDTPLADLRNGQGISPGSIAISDGQNTSIIDLSKAATIGDVARLIHANPPAGNRIDVEVGAQGLTLTAASGNLSITEVGGTTASDLGILTPTPAGPSVVGAALNPVLRDTTPLADVLGARARAVLRPSVPDNDIVIQADHNGPDLNGVTVSVVDDGTVQAGHEFANYDSVAKTLTIHVESGVTTAQQALDAVNQAHQQDPAAMPFTAALDRLDDQQGGQGVISVADTPPVVTHDGSGADLDQTHGLQITNGPYSKTIDISKAATVEDLVNTLNSAGVGVLAAINQANTGIDVRTRLSGADFSIGENGGATATQLGIRTFDTGTPLAQLNFGHGVSDYQGPGATAQAKIQPGGANSDLVIEARKPGPEWDNYTVNIQAVAAGGQESVSYDPAQHTIDIYVRPGVTTANQVIAMINGNGPLSADFTARLDPTNDSTNNGAGAVSPVTATTVGGTDDGADFAITRNDGVTFEIGVQGAKTIGDVLNLINNDPTNQNTNPPLVARLAASGNGIELVDNSVGPGHLTVTRLNSSEAATDLGLLPAGQDSASSSTSGNQPDLLTGSDVNPQETTGMFTALIRLQQGLTANDNQETQRAMAMLQQTTTDMNFARAELGAREQGLGLMQTRLSNDNLELQQNLSDTYDTDMAQVISDLTAEQTALQASLQATARTMQMTLLNYL